MQSLTFFSEKVVKVSFKLIFNLSKYCFGTYLLIEGSWKICTVCKGCDSFETCVLHLKIIKVEELQKLLTLNNECLEIIEIFVNFATFIYLWLWKNKTKV